MEEKTISNEQNFEEFITYLISHPKEYRDYLLDLMIENNATDMYLTYNEPPVLRIMDQVHRLKQLPVFEDNILTEVAYMFMDDVEWELFRKNKDIDLWYSYKWRRFRLNISYQQKHIMVVIRLLAEKVPTIDELGLPSVLKKLTKKKSWIILLAWPTWSWKSTTLAAMIEEINQNFKKHIITIEDPIEYVFEPKQSVIEQKQLGSDVKSFASALRSALRQKPDVILFWEMRDLDSIQNAITLAETWHLVLTTIHSRSSAQTITKIIDAFPSNQQNQIRIQIAETITAIISQRLLPRKDNKWMIPVHEIMINNVAIANLIRENQISQINNIIQTHKKDGMQLLEDDLLDKISNWLISVESAISTANNPNYIMNELKNRGIL